MDQTAEQRQAKAIKDLLAIVLQIKERVEVLEAGQEALDNALQEIEMFRGSSEDLPDLPQTNLLENP